MRGLGRALLAPGLTLGALAAIYTPLLLGEVVVSRDAARLFHPVRVYLAERLSRGELPLWYPYEALGVPFAGAVVTAVFHPLSWLVLPLGPIAAGWAITIVGLALAGLGVFALARAHGADRFGASLALVLALGGGSLVSTMDNQTFLLGAAALPFFLLGLTWALREPSRRRGVALGAAALGWALLVGDVQVAYVMGLLALPFAAFLRQVPLRAAAARVALVGGLGAALGAVQLYLGVRTLLGSDRGEGLPWAAATELSMHPLRLPELFLGDLLAYAPDGAEPQPLALLELGGHAPWQLSTYLGVFALAGLVLALFPAGERRTPAVLVALAGMCMWLALGRYGGLYRILHAALPFWSAFRHPEKLMLWAQLLIAVAAGLGFTTARRRPEMGYRVLAVLAALLVAASLVFRLLGASADPAVELWLSRAASGALRGSLLLAAASALLGAAASGRLLRLGPVLVVLLALADLASAHQRLAWTMSAPADVLAEPSPVAAFLENEGIKGPGRVRVTTHAGRPIGVGPPEEAGAWGFAGEVRWERAGLSPNHAALFGVETTGHYLPAVSPRYRAMALDEDGSWVGRWSGLYNGRFVILDRQTYVERRFPSSAIVLDRPDLSLTVAENASALPRAFLAEPRFLPNQAAVRAQLGAPEVRRGEVVLVEAAPVASHAAKGPGPHEGSAVVTAYEAERVTVRTRSRGPAALVLNDAWHPDWVATVGGETVEILRANFLVRAVLVPAGAHEVAFSLPRPPLLLHTGILSLLTGLALVWMGASRRRR